MCRDLRQCTPKEYYPDSLSPQQREDVSNQYHVSDWNPVSNDGQEAEASIASEIVYHCADILPGLCWNDRRAVVDELLLIF